jgi:alpha/beta superfamily hydrolase
LSAGALPERQDVILQGPAGEIEARFETPQAVNLAAGGAVAAFGVVCHPHSLSGGTLDNKVVYTVARAFHDLGMPTIRFNFRGVGKSGGTFADGIGETDDALAVIEAGRQRWPGAALWLAGFSFGGAVAIRAAARTNPERLVTVAPAIRRVSLEGISFPRGAWLIVQGDSDDLVNPVDVTEWASKLPNPPEIEVLPGVGHFFHGKLNELRDVVTRFGRKG